MRGGGKGMSFQKWHRSPDLGRSKIRHSSAKQVQGALRLAFAKLRQPHKSPKRGNSHEICTSNQNASDLQHVTRSQEPSNPKSK